MSIYDIVMFLLLLQYLPLFFQITLPRLKTAQMNITTLEKQAQKDFYFYFKTSSLRRREHKFFSSFCLLLSPSYSRHVISLIRRNNFWKHWIDFLATLSDKSLCKARKEDHKPAKARKEDHEPANNLNRINETKVNNTRECLVALVLLKPSN